MREFDHAVAIIESAERDTSLPAQIEHYSDRRLVGGKAPLSGELIDRPEKKRHCLEYEWASDRVVTNKLSKTPRIG